MMDNKKVFEFDYMGGSQSQDINVRGTNLPWRYECNENWIEINKGISNISFTILPTYDFRNRTATINIFDKFDNKLSIDIIQHGYHDLSVECSDSIVLYHTYYNTNSNFNAYLTVYGGQHQEPVCRGLKPYIKQVWDNSSIYNDYVITIPETLKGEFTITHKDAKDFIKYCKDNDIEYDASKLKKTIKITQVSSDDAIGNMKISINGNEYNCNDKPIVYIDDIDFIDIDILSTQYIHVLSSTKYDIIDTKEVIPQKMAYWVEYDNKPGLIRIKANEKNNFSERECIVRLTNITNSRQYINLSVRQKSSIKD